MIKQFLLGLSAAFALILGGTAFGGGWESSGDRAASPVMSGPAVGPFNYLCELEASYSKGREQRNFKMTEALTDDRFKDGFVQFTTDANSAALRYLKGHRVTLSLMGQKPEEQIVNLTLEMERRLKSQKLVVSDRSQALRSKGTISAKTSLEISPRTKDQERETLSLSGTCRNLSRASQPF